jgi:hypothetical protein
LKKYILKLFSKTVHWKVDENRKRNVANSKILKYLSNILYLLYFFYWFSIEAAYLIWDEVVLSKTVLSNFCPKQPNESIGGPRASIFELFIAILTWPNLTGLNRPLSPFFHPLTLPGYPLFCCLFSENWKMEIKRSWVELLNFLLVA